jgi:hypothetical protein
MRSPVAVIAGFSKILLTCNVNCFRVSPYEELDRCFWLFLFLVYTHAPGVLFVPIGKTKAMGAKPMAFFSFEAMEKSVAFFIMGAVRLSPEERP